MACTLLSRPWAFLTERNAVINTFLHRIIHNEAMNKSFLFLANAMISVDRLQLLGRINNRFNKKNMCRFKQIQAFWTELQREQQTSNIRVRILVDGWNNKNVLIIFDVIKHDLNIPWIVLSFHRICLIVDYNIWYCCELTVLPIRLNCWPNERK